MSTEQLKALREQADEIAKATARSTAANPYVWNAADVLRLACDRAIASLETAEQPKACACGGGAGTSGWSHSIHGCHHLPKPPAEQAQQPASDVPECPFRPLQLVPVTDRSVADLIAWGTATRAACVRIAQERDAARRNANEVHERFMQAASERDESAARNEGILLDMRTLLHERDEARRELAALKGQEPVAWRYKHSLGYTFSGIHPGYGTHEGRSSQPLYAAPVPAPDSVPLAQHKAEVAQARREGLREALEAVCATGEGEASRANTAIRRALAEKGGEVGKP